MTLTDFKQTFLNAGECAEAVSYTPSGGSPKSILAVIDRSPINPGAADNGLTLTRECEIFIAKDATDGVLTVTKSDMVSFPGRLGDASNIDWRIIEIIENDDAAWRLRVRK